MTKALIKTNYDDASYGVQLVDDISQADALITDIAQKLIDIEQDVLDAGVAVVDKKAELDEQAAVVDGVLAQAVAAGDPLDSGYVVDAVRLLQQINSDYLGARRDEAAKKGGRASLASKKTSLENAKAAAAHSEVQIWCADYTTDLEVDAEVAVIVVPGENAGNPLVIRPGYDDDAAWSHDVNGWLTPPWSCTAEQSFSNYAMLPGWQRWMPRYRYGIIQEIHSDETADVLIDPAVSSAKHRYTLQRFGVNLLQQGQPTLLENVPFQYMNCDWEAFAVDDYVVIELREQQSGPFSASGWGDPWIIGFVTRPRTCLLFLESGMVDLHWLRIAIAQNTSSAGALYYPQTQQNLISPWGGVAGEYITTDKPIWLDWTGTIGESLGSRFRPYQSPPLDSLSITTERSGPVDANRYVAADAQYMQMALPGKLKFVIAANFGAKQYSAWPLDPYCKKPTTGQTFGICTDVVYPEQASENNPVRLDYYLVWMSAGEPMQFYLLEYDDVNPDVQIARQEFYDIGPPRAQDDDATRYARRRAEAAIVSTIVPPDWDVIAETPDYFTAFDLDITGAPEDYGFQIDYEGSRVALATRETHLDGSGKTEKHTARFYSGTITPRYRSLFGNTVFDVTWVLADGPTDYTPQHFGDYLFRYNFQRNEHEWRSYVGNSGAYQEIDEPRAPVYAFFDHRDRLNILYHYYFKYLGPDPMPSNWNTFNDEVFTCSPLTETATGTLIWRTGAAYDDHGYFCERESGAGSGSMEEIWNHVTIDTIAVNTKILSKTYNVSANVQELIIEPIGVVDQIWGDPDFHCGPDEPNFPDPGPDGEGNGYEQTVHQGDGLSELIQNNTRQKFESYVIIPGFDCSSVFAGYQGELEDGATRRINYQNAAIAVQDTPGHNDDPGTGRILQWRVRASLTNGDHQGGSGQYFNLFSTRWRLEGRIYLTGKTDDPIETAALDGWLNLAGENEPETTDNLDAGESSADRLEIMRGRWKQFNNVGATDPYIEPFRAKFSVGADGLWLADFNQRDDPDAQIGRSEGVPLLRYNWDMLWIGHS